MKSELFKKVIIEDPAIHNWLKKAIVEIDEMDCVDAEANTNLLNQYALKKMNEILRKDN